MCIDSVSYKTDASDATILCDAVTAVAGGVCCM